MKGNQWLIRPGYLAGGRLRLTPVGVKSFTPQKLRFEITEISSDKSWTSVDIKYEKKTWMIHTDMGVSENGGTPKTHQNGHF